MPQDNNERDRGDRPFGGIRRSTGIRTGRIDESNAREDERPDFPGLRDRFAIARGEEPARRKRMSEEREESGREDPGEGRARQAFDIQADEELFEREQTTGRINLLQDHLRRDPLDHKGFEMLADSWERIGRHDRAQRAREFQLRGLQEQLRADPEDPETLFQMGNVWEQLGDRKRAEQVFTMARNLAEQRAEVDPFPTPRRSRETAVGRPGRREEDQRPTSPQSVFN